MSNRAKLRAIFQQATSKSISEPMRVEMGDSRESPYFCEQAISAPSPSVAGSSSEYQVAALWQLVKGLNDGQGNLDADGSAGLLCSEPDARFPNHELGPLKIDGITTPQASVEHRENECLCLDCDGRGKTFASVKDGCEFPICERHGRRRIADGQFDVSSGASVDQFTTDAVAEENPQMCNLSTDGSGAEFEAIPVSNDMLLPDSGEVCRSEDGEPGECPAVKDDRTSGEVPSVAVGEEVGGYTLKGWAIGCDFYGLIDAGYFDKSGAPVSCIEAKPDGLAVLTSGVDPDWAIASVVLPLTACDVSAIRFDHGYNPGYNPESSLASGVLSTVCETAQSTCSTPHDDASIEVKPLRQPL
jgi:hypothetical protein